MIYSWCIAYFWQEILAVVDNSKKLSVWNFTTGEKKGEELVSYWFPLYVSVIFLLF